MPVPGPDSITASPASLTSPAFAAELWDDRNPFSAEWGRASRALDPNSITHFPSSQPPAASVPKTPLPGQVSARGNNPFAAGWGQDPQGCGTEVSWGLSVPSDCPFNDNNPFLSRPGGGQAVPGFFQTGSSPSCPAGGEECPSAGAPAPGAPGGPGDVALTRDVTAVPDPRGTLSAPPGLAQELHCDSAQLQAQNSLESSKPGTGKSVSFVPGGWQGAPCSGAGLGGQEGAEQHLEARGRLRMGFGGDPSAELCGDSTHPTWDSGGTALEVTGVSRRGDKGLMSLSKPSDSPEPEAEQALSPSTELREEQEPCGGEQRAGFVPVVEPQAPPPAGNEPLSQTQPSPRGCRVSPGEGDPGGAGSDILVPPKPAPRLAVLLRKPPLTSQAAVPASGDGVKSPPGLPIPAARGGSLGTVPPPVALRAVSSGRALEKEGDGDFPVSATSVRSAIPVPAERGPALPSLPVIPEGGSDEELLGDSQESSGVPAGDKGVFLGTGEQPGGLTALHGEQRELSDSSAAPGGGEGAAIPEPGSLAVLEAPRVCAQGTGSGSGVTSHSRDCDSHCEKQELQSSAGVEERAERDLPEPSAFSSPLSSPVQPSSPSRPLLSDTPSRRAESPRAEGFADKAGNSGKKKLLQARVSPSETFPNPAPARAGETESPKHR